MAGSEGRFTAVELEPGRTYRVVAPFVDYDGIAHPIGETFRFVEKHFLPYEDGLTLMVDQQGRADSWRLQWREEAQAEVIDNFSSFVEIV